MKKINKDYLIGLFIGLISVIVTDLLVNTEKYVIAFKEGYDMAKKSEIKK
ncbi:hypothetical protein SAMN05661096_01117 [Marivirga sericea]|uniref:Uncharacterized protein n=1 Tax=Marivirga sericea TaxID=1028 RepID=A0A1X7J076_9BACT|nr:hypothetical protein [Marivirga sericea]SMG20676.1 hypothetical protein SAMN05661096_01117 [Marivirga sericea]